MPFFFGKKSAAERSAEQTAHDYMTEGARLAEDLIGNERSRLMDESLKDPSLARFLADHGRHLILDLELQFLWGFFFQYVQTRKLPTNGYDRISLHLIHHLINLHGLSLDEARSKVAEVNRKFNSADPSFEAISDVGKRAFQGDEKASILMCVREICDEGILNEGKVAGQRD